MRFLCLIGLLLAACAVSTPREGAHCDQGNVSYVCHDGALWECHGRGWGTWIRVARCPGPAGCSWTPPTATEWGRTVCDAVVGDPCADTLLNVCTPDGTAALACPSSKVERHECDKGCEHGLCRR